MSFMCLLKQTRASDQEVHRVNVIQNVIYSYSLLSLLNQTFNNPVLECKSKFYAMLCFFTDTSGSWTPSLLACGTIRKSIKSRVLAF